MLHRCYNLGLTWSKPPEEAAGRLLQLLRLGEGVHGGDDDAVAPGASWHQHLHVADCGGRKKNKHVNSRYGQDSSAFMNFMLRFCLGISFNSHLQLKYRWYTNMNLLCKSADSRSNVIRAH